MCCVHTSRFGALINCNSLGNVHAINAPCHQQKLAMSQYKLKLNPGNEQQTQPSWTLIRTADDDETIAAARVWTEEMIPWATTLSANDTWPQWMCCNQIDRFQLEDHFEGDMLWYSFWDDVNGGWLKTDKVDEGSKVGLD